MQPVSRLQTPFVCGVPGQRQQPGVDCQANAARLPIIGDAARNGPATLPDGIQDEKLAENAGPFGANGPPAIGHQGGHRKGRPSQGANPRHAKVTRIRPLTAASSRLLNYKK